MKALHSAKTQFEAIESAQGFAQLSPDAQKSFKQYRYGKIQELDEFGTAKEHQKYKDIFEDGHKLAEFFHKLLVFLKGNFATPLDFKEKFEEFSNENKHLLSGAFDSVVGTENTQEESTLLINRSGLSLYRYLDFQIAKYNIQGPLANYITELLHFIDLMRIRAFELSTEIQEGGEFVKSTDETGDATLLATGVKALNTVVNEYEVAEGENALIDNLQHFMLPTREQWVDYEKLKDFKVARDEENAKLLEKLGIYSKKWMDLADTREDLYTAKSIKTLAAIIQSNLYDDPEKVKLINEIGLAVGALKKKTAQTRLDSYIMKAVEKKFAALNKSNTFLKNLLKLFQEKSALTEARNDKNAKAEKHNQRPGLAEKEKQKIEETPPLTLENMELAGVIHSFIKMNKNLSFEQFWEMVEQHHDSEIAQFVSALSMTNHKEEFKHLCQVIFKWIKEDTSERKSLNALFEKVIIAHDHHIGFMSKMGDVSLAFKAVKPHLPVYSLDQQTIDNKVKELEHLIAQKPGAYLISEPEFRAVNYAYNFPMFSDQALQPLKPEMEIWGTAKKADVTKLLAALRAAHTAYIQARDAIKAINPAAEDRGIHAKLFGGFDQETILIQSSQSQSKKTQTSKSTWTKKVTKPFPDKLVDVCNHCVLEIEGLIKTKVATHDALDPYMSTAKETILHQIIILLQENFKFLDQPVPEEAEFGNIITKACDHMKTHIDAMINEVHEALQGKPGKSKSSGQHTGGTGGSVSLPKMSLRSVQPGSKTSSAPLESPFQIKLKSHSSEKQHVIITEMEITEKEITSIQPAGTTEVLKKQADEKRLEKIKAFLEKEKGAEFVNGFTDPELLAFQLHVLVGLTPDDLKNNVEGFEVAGFGKRKFSPKTLEYIKDLRFSKDPGTRVTSDHLISEQVKTENPSNLLRNILGMHQGRIDELRRDGHLV